MSKILVINPGSTSTKIAVYEASAQIELFSVHHSVDELMHFPHVIDQFDFRYALIVSSLEERNIPMDFSVVMGRGGMLPPVESGIYEVNEKMLSTLRQAERGEHASNLGAFLADKIARQIPGCKAYIADPVSVDEMEEVARISGMPEIPRHSIFHALNHKAAGRFHASKAGKKYEEMNLVIAHLGGGVSVAAHKKGRVVDVNQGLDGYGPISPERSGTIDAGLLVKLCFSGKHTETEILRKLAGKGGLTAHLGSNDVQELVKKAEGGDKKTAQLLHALAYSISKEIGSMLVVLRGEVDGVILTGGVAFSDYIVNMIKQMIKPYAQVFVLPGEDEMGALAANAVRLLNGEQAKEF
ncbi:MAG: butyrate kinase [Porphyromonadaceae bacterium]|jgi:butyrate kinase|nr:butyrate kinase [Porphyromonadaceae bacterium]